MTRRGVWGCAWRQAYGVGVSAWLASTGCLPYAIPPLEVAVASGPATGARSARPQGRRASPVEGMVDARVAIHPLGLIPSLTHRPVDGYVGYAYQGGTARNVFGIHTGYLGMEWFPWQSSNEIGRFRGRVYGSLDVGSADLVGGTQRTLGSTFGVGLEYAGFVGGTPFLHVDGDPDDGGFLFGLAQGEVSIGLTLGTVHRALPGDDFWMGFFGVSGRIPASVGVICCAWDD